ncbi:MAG TPA: histidine kinase dimerization/phospho-acceptor domain-containing protein, partial [Longilinea sp.]|nr:histidine kinase dimerization/phospho-acceptor domain-containing protein [Longilinea sp.]
MSLRLRLSILYTALLGSVLLIFGLVVYVLVSVNLLNQIDTSLISVANSLTTNLEVDSSNRFDLSVITTFQTAENILFQLWGSDGSLQITRPPDWQTSLDAIGLQTDQMVLHSVSIGGVHLRVLSVPLSSPRGASGVLQVGVSQAYLDITQDTLATVLVVITLFAMLVTALISWSATGKTLKPLDTVTRVAKKIVQADDLSRRIPEGEVEDDEIGSLISAYNSSLERVEKLFNAQRRFLADVSHDLRTPLTVIKGNVSLMRKMRKADEESLQQIDQEVDRLTRLVGDLLLLAQAETGNLDLDLQPLELDNLVKEVFHQIKLLAGKKLTLKLEELDPVVVLGDRDRLKQVLLNLAGNAIQYTP